MGILLPSHRYPYSSSWMPRNVTQIWTSLCPSQCTCFRFFLHLASSLPRPCCSKASGWLYERTWREPSPKQLSVLVDRCAAVYLRKFRMKSGCEQTRRTLGKLRFGSLIVGKHSREAERQRTQTAGENRIDPSNAPILSSLMENP